MDFFIKESNIEEGILHTGSFINIENKASKNISEVKSYYNNRVARVENDNIFVKIINDLYNSELSTFDYIFKIKSRRDYVLRNYGIVCSGYSGKIIHNETLHNSREVFISIDTDNTNLIVENDIDNNWKDIVPVECIYHCYKDMLFLNPNNRLSYSSMEKEDNIIDENLIIYNVDIIKLMVMFRYYKINAEKLDRATSISEFVYRYVYANLTNSFFNISLLNRYMDVTSDKINSNDININNKLPILLMDIESPADHFLLDFNKKVKLSTKKTYTYLMSNINLIDTNALDILSLENIDINITVLNRWSIILSKLKYILFCLDIYGKNGIRANKLFVTKLRSLFKLYYRENMYVPNEIKDYFNYYMDEINLIIGKQGE